MNKFLTYIFITVFCFSSTKAEIVKKILISGNSRVSEETIKLYGNIKINQDYSENQLNSVLSDLYSTNFFEDVKLELNNGVLKVSLIEFPTINQLIILGEASVRIKDEIKKHIKLKQKESFIKNFLAQDVQIIKKLYASIGYNFSEVETKIRKIDNNSVDLIFDIEKGQETKISNIVFTGDKKVREKRLRDVIASEEDRFWKFISKNTIFNQDRVNLDLRLLKNYYKSNGYYDVKISSNSAEIKKSGNIELIYSIEAGKRYLINKISTNVDPVFDKDIFFSLNKNYEKIIGSYYSPFKIKELLEDIDILIEKNNLQFVEHNVEETIEGENISIKFNIFEGEKILVERINILGNNVTDESVIRAELLLDEGDPFTKLGLDKSVSKLKSRNIFRTIKTNVSDGSSNDVKIIDIVVEEQATGEIGAGAGVGTNGGSFAFNIQENNWLGEGKNLSFDLQLDQESLNGTMSYSDPNYDFLGNSLNYYLTSTSNDKPDQGYKNTLVGLGINTTFEQYKDIFATLGLSATIDDLQTQNSASDSLKKQEGEFLEVAGNYGFTLDKRNRAFMPTDGSILKFSQSLPIFADKAFISNNFSASKYKTITENVIGATKFHFMAVNGIGNDDVRISKRRSLSSRKLRGFEKGKVGPIDGTDHIGGNYAAAINLEANLPNLLPESTNTEVGLFLDFGNVWGVDYTETIDDNSKIRSSTGVAASWLSPVGPMTFILSTNLAKADTDVTESFNFNLGTTF